MAEAGEMAGLAAGNPGGKARGAGMLCVVVLYKRQAVDSVTLQTLRVALEAASGVGHRHAVMIFDNTPGGQERGALPEGVRYLSAPSNPGLAQSGANG